MVNKDKFRDQYSFFDKEIVVEIIDIFINEYDDRIEKIHKHILSGDLDNLKKSSHAFRGVIGNFETDCSAYKSIEKIELSSIQQVEVLDEEDDLDDSRKQTFFKEMDREFNKFRSSSFELLKDLKIIREEYAE
nr:Hpt domain-containing protein [Bacteroidota bacterium]